MADLRQEIFARIRALVDQYFALGEPPGSRQVKIPLHMPSYGPEEVNETIGSLLTTRVTMGEKVRRFEALWAQYLGVTNAVMVNSGSSANLLAASILSNPRVPNRLRPGDEVIVPAVAWSTTYFPLVNVGAVPVLVDVNLDTFTLDPGAAEQAVTARTRAIMPVHLLGNPCDMRQLQELARNRDLFLIEDACEAHGAQFEGRKVGSFGQIGTFSFYFSHHISTIEGGMLVTFDDRFADLARVLRAHGWQRDVKRKTVVADVDIDERYLFVNLGYNLRPTELQGAFGIHQVARLEEFIQVRRENTEYWNSSLRKYSDWLTLSPGCEAQGSRSVWFGYPMTVRPAAPFSRRDLTRFLEAQGIETRPVMAGNFRDQPAIRLFPHRVGGPLPNAEVIMRSSFFIGNHHGIGERERAYVKDCIDEFMRRWA
jgi:CDP-6-deoxy-D-xylo-4-hexulose-3-dehydrase